MMLTTETTSTAAATKRGGGPRSSEGRAVSSLNARKHGLAASERLGLLPNEDPAEYFELAEQFRSEHHPVGPTETVLVERLIAAAWRLRRAAAFEAGVLKAEGASEDGPGMAAYRDANKGNGLQLAVRYVRAAELSFSTSLNQLERRQALRRGESVPVPVAVDVSISGPQADDP